MLVGYERVSTDDQNLDLQHDALVEAGCEKFFSDKMSGAKFDRPGLTECLNFLREGDVLVIWKLDRLGRSLKDLLSIVEDLERRGVGFKCIQESWDTTSPGGKFIFQIFGALAELERSIIRQRTKAGLAAARARGRNGGRPKVLTAQRIEIGQTLAKDRTRSVGSICEHLGISRQTYYRYIAPRRRAT